MSNDPPSDPSQLIWQAREGAPEALGNLLELYRRYLSFLARTKIHRELQRKVDPSDIVQEVFLDAQRDFPHFRGKTERELVSWLRSILACNLTDHLQRYYGAQRRDVAREQHLGQQPGNSSQAVAAQLAGQKSTPSQGALRRERAVLLADAMERLPEDYREVLMLRNFEQLPFSEVAMRMDRSLGSVQKIWTRALVKLRSLMRDDDATSE